MIGASCRAAVQCARRAGLQAYAVDQFCDRDLSESADALLMHDVQNEGAELASRFPNVPILLAGGMENYPAVVDAILQSRNAMGHATGCCGIDGKGLRQIRDPRSWRRWAIVSGMEWPSSWFAGEPMPTADSNGQWLRKRVTSAGGLGVSFASIDDVPGTDGYLQRRWLGQPIGVAFLSDASRSIVIGGTIALTSEDWWGPTEFIYRGNLGPIPLSSSMRSKLTSLADLVRSETGIRGLWQADFMRVGDTLCLLEINPRWTASMELLDSVLGIRLVRLHLEAIHETESIVASITVPDSRWVAGKQVIYAKGTICPTPEALARWWSHRLDWKEPCQPTWTDEVPGWYADIPGTTARIEQGYPVMTVMTIGESTAIVEDTLHRMSDQLHRELETMRAIS